MIQLEQYLQEVSCVSKLQPLYMAWVSVSSAVSGIGVCLEVTSMPPSLHSATDLQADFFETAI